MSDETIFMIAHGASVGIVRDGKKVTISAGGGADFTQDEIDSVLRVQPGALRKPVNEGTGKSKAKTEESEDGTVKKTTKPTAKTGKAKAPAKEKAADTDDGDADEDEDI